MHSLVLGKLLVWMLANGISLVVDPSWNSCSWLTWQLDFDQCMCWWTPMTSLPSSMRMPSWWSRLWLMVGWDIIQNPFTLWLTMASPSLLNLLVNFVKALVLASPFQLKKRAGHMVWWNMPLRTSRPSSAIQTENPDQDPEVSLVLAAGALNSTEYVSGFSSYQWCFGRDYTISEEDSRNFAQLSERETYSNLVAARQKAEDAARKSRAQRILSKLNNTRVRQPLRDYKPTELVMVWRQVLPKDVHTGPRGGSKKSSKPGWIGPGRVVFSEPKSYPIKIQTTHVDTLSGW